MRVGTLVSIWTDLGVTPRMQLNVVDVKARLCGVVKELGRPPALTFIVVFRTQVLPTGVFFASILRFFYKKNSSTKRRFVLWRNVKEITHAL